MKLLVLTQEVDIGDPVLGFFHRWVEEFAKHCEKVVVVCLSKGKYNFPKNVAVYSLGKEGGRSRLKYLFRFYKYIWQERKNYDAVFVHMNSEYAVLGGMFWKLWAKKILLWNNHARGNLATRLALKIVDKSFYTSLFSFNARNSGVKGCQMPVGIDSEFFRRDGKIEKSANSLLFLGRFSPIKKLDVLIEAAKLVDRERINFTLNIVGDPSEKDTSYFKEIKTMAGELEKVGRVRFFPSVSNYVTPRIYNENEIFINLTNSGSLDKTIVEAAFCESLVLVSNESLRGALPKEMFFEENNIYDLARKIIVLLKKDKTEKENMGRELGHWAVRNHSLTDLVGKILIS